MRRKCPLPSRVCPLPSIVRLVAAMQLVGCAAEGPADGPLVAQRDTIGDTIIVRTVSGSVWERPLSFREDLRIGVLEGSEVESFGAIQGVAVGADGSILVLDYQGPVLRQFDSTGRYLRDFGRRGQGPGEYQQRGWGLVVGNHGQVFLPDVNNGRINVYSGSGEARKAILGMERLIGGNRPIAVDTTGHIYVNVFVVDFAERRREQGSPPRPLVGLLHLDRSGAIIDTIFPPEIDGPPESAVWALHPYGHIVVGSNTTYTFEIRRQEGSVVRVSLPHTPVPFSDAGLATRAEDPDVIRAREADRLGGEPQDAQPEFRPAYNRFHFGSDGRIWVQRYIVDEGSSSEQASSSRFLQATAFDVFEEDGTYLGFARFPQNARPLVFTSTHVYAVETGEYDEQYVVRYRLGN